MRYSFADEVAQRAYITLFADNGRALVVVEKYLQAGNNSTTMSVGSFARGMYIVNLAADRFKDAERVKIK